MIKVCAGRYAEQATITVDKPLKIEGDGASVMRTDGMGDEAETINAADCFSPTRPTFDPNVHVIVAPRLAPQNTEPTVLFDLQADDIELEGFILYGDDNTTLNSFRAAVETSAAHSGYEIHHNFFVAHSVATFLRSNGQRPSSYHDNCLRENRSGVANAGLGLIDARVHNNSSFRTRTFAYEQTRCNTCPSLIGMANVTFDHNVSVDDREGFRFAVSTDTLAFQNSVTSAEFGMRLFGGTARLRIIDNYVEVHQVGMPRHSEPPTAANVSALIQGNLITQAYPVATSGNSAGIGIGIGGLKNSQILDNVINGFQGGGGPCNGCGIALSEGNTDNVVRGNTVTNNVGDGIHVAAGATSNLFQENTMLGNGTLSGVDARDLNTALPLNVWKSNVCLTDFPVGTICPPTP